MQNPFIGVDIETTGLYPIIGKSKIYCLAINIGKKIDAHINIEQHRSFLEDPSIVKIIHNAAFDSFWLKRLYNITVRNIWDTRLMEQVIIGETLPRTVKDEGLREELSSSLKYTLQRYGFPVHDKSIGAEFATRDPNKPLTKKELDYAKDDVRHLPALMKLQRNKLEQLGLMEVAKLENSLVEVVVEMRARGLGFNESIWMEIYKHNEAAYNKLMSKLPKVVSNWNSPKQVKEYFQSIGIPIQSLTGIEDFQKTYKNKTLDTFIEARSLYKSVTTYGASWLEDEYKGGSTLDADNRVRPDYEQILNTGRFSCSHPNMQQLPRDGGHKAAFVPAPNHVIVLADYTSQEIGIAAAASEEQKWIDAILRGEDVHSLQASIIFPDIWEQGYIKGCTFPMKCDCPIHSERRQIAKTTGFTILYGGGAKNISIKTGISQREAERVVYKFKRSVLRLTRWLDNNAKNAIRMRMSFSADPYKRRRTMRDPENWMLANIGKNNPIQACGANMIKRAMVNLDQTICPLILTEHDALACEPHKSKADKAVKHLKITMEEAADYCTGIPGLIKAEPKITNSLLK